MRETKEARSIVSGGGIYEIIDWREEGRQRGGMLKAAQDRVIRQHNRIVELQQENERLRMNALAGRLPVAAALSVQNCRMHLQTFTQRLFPVTEMFLKEQKHRLEIIKGKMEAASPEHILAMGYSITRVNGKAVRSVDELMPGDEVTTSVAGGEFTSTVTRLVASGPENK